MEILPATVMDPTGSSDLGVLGYSRGTGGVGRDGPGEKLEGHPVTHRKSLPVVSSLGDRGTV